MLVAQMPSATPAMTPYNALDQRISLQPPKHNSRASTSTNTFAGVPAYNAAKVCMAMSIA